MDNISGGSIAAAAVLLGLGANAGKVVGLATAISSGSTKKGLATGVAAQIGASTSVGVARGFAASAIDKRF